MCFLPSLNQKIRGTGSAKRCAKRVQFAPIISEWLCVYYLEPVKGRKTVCSQTMLSLPSRGKPLKGKRISGCHIMQCRAVRENHKLFFYDSAIFTANHSSPSQYGCEYNKWLIAFLSSFSIMYYAGFYNVQSVRCSW